MHAIGRPRVYACHWQASGVCMLLSGLGCIACLCRADMGDRTAFESSRPASPAAPKLRRLHTGMHGSSTSDTCTQQGVYSLVILLHHYLSTLTMLVLPLTWTMTMVVLHTDLD